MSDHLARPNPLAEIEALQDRVLRELDELNERIERTLLEHGGGSNRASTTLSEAHRPAA
jgi:hypothetical protein